MKNQDVLAEKLIKMISDSERTVLARVNEELVKLYWEMGKSISEESEKSYFGDFYMEQIADRIKTAFPEKKGFNTRGLYRMKKFYEVNKDDEFVIERLTQISWSNHMKIIDNSKTKEERHFYLLLSIRENYSARELDRQMKSKYYERYMLSNKKLEPNPIVGKKDNPFLDLYIIDFIDLPKEFNESDLKKGILENMKEFILEVGKDLTYVGQEYLVQVGGEDYRIDLVFFHRKLRCLVAFELKTGKFKPEYVSKMNFYLEALDRQKKNDFENPSVGIILCGEKNDEVVKYSMSRSLSPLMVSEYKLQLPDEKMLENKYHELLNSPVEEVQTLFGIAPGDETVEDIKDERLKDK